MEPYFFIVWEQLSEFLHSNAGCTKLIYTTTVVHKP